MARLVARMAETLCYSIGHENLYKLHTRLQTLIDNMYRLIIDLSKTLARSIGIGQTFRQPTAAFISE